MPVSKLLKMPYGSYLMVRLDYVIICGDELEAKIMRIIEMYMEDERRILYKAFLNDPKNTVEPEATVEITRDVRTAISHRLIKNDLYDQEMSENTLKRALKSLVKKQFIRVKDDRTKRYEAPKYQINTDVVQGELDLLGKVGKTEYQKLMVSKIDGIKNASHQEMTPADHQNLTVSRSLMVSKIDPNSRRVTDSVDGTEEEGTYRASGSQEQECADAPAPSSSQDQSTLENTPYRPSQASHSHETTEDTSHGFSGNSGDHLRGDRASDPVDAGEHPQSAAGHTGHDVRLPAARTDTASSEGRAERGTGDARTGSTGNGVASPAGGGSGYQKTGEKPQQQTLAGAQYQPPVRTQRGSQGKGKGNNNRISWSLEGAAFRGWYEELTGVVLDETAANARACNSLGKRASVTYDNLKMVVKEIRTNKWVKRERVAVTVQDMASDDKMLRWEKWLLAAQQDSPHAPLNIPTREEDPYSVAALIAEQNPGYFAGRS